ncbi:zinc-binding dehydrogenase [Asaia sp. As-1742]|uniref:zinc-binding dehydrogenase n=1 Tax=Asaia sp. As-1742 TaxID=2608325 RepID=UPI00141F17FD|nr:zinc-binding dehydrogenase [Asaia sp. As-1742]NIE79215.1 alcohol dehydrogenase catalytic domain-containing protein [Asaia sp. As-1742]
MMTSLTSTYHAWTWLEPGEPEQLRLVEQVVAPPGPGEILVRNTMIALNPVDWKVIAQGPAEWKPGHVPGVDGVGIVSAVGDGVSVPVGGRVAYHQAIGKPGSFAGYTTVDADCALVVPQGVSDESAAGIPCPGLTAWQALTKVPDMPNRDVLVTGAGGAVALILAQLALRRKWRVWATASPIHRERLLALGIAGVFDYRDGGWCGQLTDALGPRRLFAAFDTTSGAYARTLAPLIGYNGHLVCIQDRLDAPPLSPFTTALSLHEVALNSAHGHATAEDWREWRHAGAQLLEAVQIGTLDLQPHVVIAFDDLPTSLSALKHQRIKGKKILVRVEMTRHYR